MLFLLNICFACTKDVSAAHTHLRVQSCAVDFNECVSDSFYQFLDVNFCIMFYYSVYAV
jgi:hypothetical protein